MERILEFAGVEKVPAIFYWFEFAETTIYPLHAVCQLGVAAFGADSIINRYILIRQAFFVEDSANIIGIKYSGIA